VLKINAPRLLADLEALGAIGAASEGGVSRPAMSAADLQARAWFRLRVEEAGLQFHQDGAGNTSAVLPAAEATARTLLAGSHLDTVPQGGRYDGALGVLAALEALRTVQEAGVALPVHLEAISFTDEEGALLDMLGSRAVAAQLAPADLARPRGGLEDFQAGLGRLGITPDSVLAARRDPASLLAYLELHVEQGSRLEEAGTGIGVVTSVVGIRSAWLRFEGRAAHAGTTPMDRRADALLGASAFVQRARQLVLDRFAPGVVNCGQMRVLPGAFNIVPGRVELALEYRHGSEAEMDAMEAALLGLAAEAAAAHGLVLAQTPASRARAAPMSAQVMSAVEAAADRLSLSHRRMMSFAGHDAQWLSTVAPSGMLFVPSVGGISHNPQEFTRPEDVVNGANVLLYTLLELASSQGTTTRD
jgi:N-carbamoyl-L-amino-acid hydrolase